LSPERCPRQEQTDQDRGYEPQQDDRREGGEAGRLVRRGEGLQTRRRGRGRLPPPRANRAYEPSDDRSGPDRDQKRMDREPLGHEPVERPNDRGDEKEEHGGDRERPTVSARQFADEDVRHPDNRGNG